MEQSDVIASCARCASSNHHPLPWTPNQIKNKHNRKKDRKKSHLCEGGFGLPKIGSHRRDRRPPAPPVVAAGERDSGKPPTESGANPPAVWPSKAPESLIPEALHDVAYVCAFIGYTWVSFIYDEHRTPRRLDPKSSGGWTRFHWPLTKNRHPLRQFTS